MTETDGQAPAIMRFAGAWRFLANPYPHRIVIDGQVYRSAEYAFHALKTSDPAVRRRIAEAPTWQEAKIIGHSADVNLPGDWDFAGRYDAMRRVLWVKFSDPVLGSRLVDTRGALLVEGNTWHDNTWGNCTCGRPACRPSGHNLLGWMLMRIRAEIRRSR